MTDLDQFAAAALQGLLANPNCDHLEDTDLATRAYEIASAMTEKRDHWNKLASPALSEDDHNRLTYIIEGMEDDKDHDQWAVDFLKELQERLA
jgi:TATA-binding protein-associated factor Taf7